MSFTSPFGGGGINLGNGMYEKFKTVSGYVRNGLFSTGEDGFGTRGMASIWELPGGYQAFEKKFHQFRSYSCIEDGQ